MAPRFLGTEDRGSVRILTLDNLQKRNALDFGSLLELEAACAAASSDGVRCLVFRGAGDKAFCSGFDIAAIPVGPSETSEQGAPPIAGPQRVGRRAVNERGACGGAPGEAPTASPAEGGEGPRDTDELAELNRPDLAVERTMEAVEAVPCPTIAFLNGSAFGAGAELAATCDLRVACPGVAIGMPPAKLGVVYAPAGLRRFLHLVGPSRAREMFFTGRPVDAGEALAIGLVDRVVPADEAEEATLALAEEIARNAPLAVQGMKRILRLLDAAAERGFTDAEREEISRLRRRAFESDDVREGRQAFLEKRPARFRGR